MSRWLFIVLCLVTVGSLHLRPTERSANGAPLGGQCASDSQCQSGLTCVDGAGPLMGQCAARCASDASCHQRFGQQSLCIAVDQCALACDRDQDCASGTACNAYGFCEVRQKLDG